jgi:taurine dioxygenase
MSYQLKPLSKALGAEIIGFDCHKPLSKMDLEKIYADFYHYQVLVFRNQHLSIEEQISFCQQFGEIEPHPVSDVPWKYREVTYVANYNPDTGEVYEHCGPNFELWHSDTCYQPIPVKMSFLYAERVPKAAGETLFANMVDAFETLPATIKDQIIGKEAVFGSSYELIKRCEARGYKLEISATDMLANCLHPVVRTHPVTQKNSIFVNWAHTDKITGLPEQESAELLNAIYNHCRKDEFVYTHEYQQGDLIVWDNAATIHSNTDKKLTDIRLMRRIMIKGSKPYYKAIA